MNAVHYSRKRLLKFPIRMNKVELSYWAGLFDGEGCISIRHNRPTETSKHRSDLYSMITKVTMCDGSLIRSMSMAFGVGHIGFQRRYIDKGTHRPAWSWTSMSKDAEAVIRALLPYLRSKKKEAKIALTFFDLPDGRNGKNRIDSRLTSARRRIYLKLRAAKGRLVKH